jgi:hypothetical protein
MTTLQRLPKGFRYLFSLKEIKKIEADAKLKFHRISNGNISNSEYFESNSHLQSSFSGPSVDSYKKEGTWLFGIHQNGFRIELLPQEFEGIIKEEIKNWILIFMRETLASIDTDFLEHPVLRASIRVIDNKTSVSWY